MNKTNRVLRTLSHGPRRVHQDGNGDLFVKIDGTPVSVKEPRFTFCRYETVPFRKEGEQKDE